MVLPIGGDLAGGAEFFLFWGDCGLGRLRFRLGSWMAVEWPVGRWNPVGRGGGAQCTGRDQCFVDASAADSGEAGEFAGGVARQNSGANQRSALGACV